MRPPRQTIQRKLFRSLFALLGAAVAVQAEVAVHDNWASAGDLAIQGDAWSASLARDDAALVFCADGQTVRVVPFADSGAEPDEIVQCEVLPRDSAEQVQVHVAFSARGEGLDGLFSFTSAGTLRIAPGQTMRGVTIRSPIAVGLLPGVRLEDVVYVPDKFPGLTEVQAPAEGWFAGLIDGGQGIVACAWPPGAQTISLLPEGDAAKRLFGAIQIALDGKELYVEVLAAPEIWRRETLEPEYLEKDVEIPWKRPFPATYKTQLLLRGETTTPRTFLFQTKPNVQYRPEAGECTWPVWFEGERSLLHLSKKIPPRGEAIIYPIEDGKKTLMGFLERTPVAGLIAQQNERAELAHGPRNAEDVGFVACGGTKLIRRTIFTLGIQNREKQFLSEYADFLSDYVFIVQQRNVGFLRFSSEIRAKLDAWKNDEKVSPEIRAYLDQMMQEAQQLESGLQRKMKLYGETTPEQHIARADRDTKRLKELLDTGNAELYPECEEIIDTCNQLAWAHAETMGMRFSMSARQLAQDAALACAGTPGAAEYAREIRAAVRTALNGAPPW